METQNFRPGSSEGGRSVLIPKEGCTGRPS